MKIVVINGSGTGTTGATGQTLVGVVDGARAAGAEVETFLLTNLTINPCTGCQTCQKTGQCIFDDDYQKVREAMFEADGFVLASPNYVCSVSAQVKAVLDRSFSVLIHCQAMRGKYGAVVLVSGGPQYEQVEEYMQQVIGLLGCWNVGSLVAASDQMDFPDERAKVLSRADDLGRRLAEAIKTRQRFPEQEEQLKMMFEMMHWLIGSKKDIWNYEYEYWQKHWGVDE